MQGKRLLTGVVAVAVTAGCAVDHSGGDGPGRAPVVRVAAIGDSVTEADSPDFTAGDVGPGSWAASVRGAAIEIVGGWAVSGSTMSDMVAGAHGISTDVLVLMGGTNDVLQGVPLATTLAALVELPDQNEADVVLLCSVVPSTEARAAIQTLNAALPDLARDHGWQYEDCAAPVRAADGDWVQGASTDGVHPTREAAAEVGAVVLGRVRDLVVDGRASAG